MTLKEAFEMATPGPYIVDDGRMSAGHTAIVRTEENCEGEAEYPHLNIALLAHTFNHFQEVVAALEEEHENHMEHDEHANIHGTAATCPTCRLIAKFKEVKT